MRNEYYTNGKIKSKITYKNDSVKDGEALYYDSNSNLIKQEYYRDGNNDSCTVEFYTNGNVKTKTIFYGKIPVSFYEYYSNKVIKEYYAVTFHDEYFYMTKYDSLYRKIFEKGYVICDDVGLKGKTRRLMHLNDSLGFIFLVATPPDHHVSVFIWVYKINNLSDTLTINNTPSKVIIDSCRELEIKQSVVEYNNIFKERGVYQINCAGVLIDLKTLDVKEDTVSRILKIE